MNICLSNDDGIRAPGILAMFDALCDANYNVTTIAPLTVQSATGHGITFHQPLITTPVTVPTPAGRSLKGTAVDGRPADCVKLAMSELWPSMFGAKSRPDLLVSGMNAGANCGINVIYSGTVAAALEGAFLGVPSIAVSLMLNKGQPNFALGARWGLETIQKLLADGLPDRHEVLSINIPPTDSPSLAPDAPLPPIVVCPMNTHGLIDAYDKRRNPIGEDYYWAAGHGLSFHATEQGSDVEALLRGCITVTPLKFDLTDHTKLSKWEARLKA